MSFKVLYSNDKECDDLLKILDKAGFVWHNNLKAMEYKPPLFDDGIICIDFDTKHITYTSGCMNIDCTAKNLLMLTDSYEMTAKEFIHKYKKMGYTTLCEGNDCKNCIFDATNTRCEECLCNYFDGEIEPNNEAEEELLELVKTHDSPVWNPEKENIGKDKREAVKILEKLMKSLNDFGTNDNPLMEALKIAVDNLKGESE